MTIFKRLNPSLCLSIYQLLNKLKVEIYFLDWISPHPQIGTEGQLSWCGEVTI